ncbi:MAG: site-specific integrase [Candidatus Sulfotelmatobacter sp.]
MFKRTTYQQGSLKLEERKRGPHVWVYRWWDADANGKRVYRKQQIGDLSEYPSETAAKVAIDALRLTINNQSHRNGVSQMTVQSLWEHYYREELPFKDFSTQDGYLSYAKNWILPRWGRELLLKVKTVDVERWLRQATVSNGTRAKIKCVMSALFSHAVRWEFASTNPISSGIRVGSGGKRGPSVGVRVSAKRQRAPTVLSPEQVKLGLTKLEFRDQLLVLLGGALGTRRGELAALRWQDCDFENDTFQIEHSYYWRRGGILKSTKTEASAKPLPMHPALKQALLEWKTQSHRTQLTDFVFPSRLYRGQKALDLAAVLKRKIRPAFEKLGITGVGWHTFRHTVGTVLAELGEHQLTIRDYLCHSNLSVTNKYLQAASNTKRKAQDRLVDAILPAHLRVRKAAEAVVAP